MHCCHVLCTQSVERRKLTEFHRWQIRELGNNPAVPRHDDRRPVLEEGLTVEGQKGTDGVAILSVKH